MATLVVGARGAAGRLLVGHLLERGERGRALPRTSRIDVAHFMAELAVGARPVNGGGGACR